LRTNFNITVGISCFEKILLRREQNKEDEIRKPTKRKEKRKITLKKISVERTFELP